MYRMLIYNECESCDWNAPAELNITHERSIATPGPGTSALRGSRRTATSRSTCLPASNQVANALTELGIEKRSRRDAAPETSITVLGIWKTDTIHVPLFTAFEKQALEFRINDCEPNLLLYHADYDETVTEIDTDFKRIVVSGSAAPEDIMRRCEDEFDVECAW